MKRFNLNFIEVGWLNDRVKYLINYNFFREIIAMVMNNKKFKLF